MNNLILNRDFRLPDDGWYHIAPFGEFPHARAGVIQVIDQEACIAMSARFASDAQTPNFPGLLVDFDHFSLDGEKRSEAAGWIIGLEYRAPAPESNPHPNPLPSQGEGVNAGLWAQIRWSDLGEEAVKGGRYRFLSPVWARSDCVDLGPSTGSGQVTVRVRPVRILNAAVTNDPNLKGLVPLSNSGQRGVVDFQTLYGGPAVETKAHCEAGVKGKEMEDMKAVIEKLVNHLGLAADATEAVILEKMGGLISATVVTELQNSLTALQTKHDSLVSNLKTVEDELVNRHLADFEGLINEESKPFWAQQLIQNRVGALAVLGDLREMAGNAAPAPDTSKGVNKESTKKPLHNRATARPVPPHSAGSTGSPQASSGQPGQGSQTGADGGSKAVKIRNRAQEIAVTEKIPFIVAFRRAEREIVGQ
jgi:phage I-like protein